MSDPGSGPASDTAGRPCPPQSMPGGWFRHPQALVETKEVGSGTRIWAFAHVLGGAAIGTDCNLCDGVFVEDGVRIGNRVTVKCGVQLWRGVTLEDDVFVGPNATFTNDLYPRSREWSAEPLRTLVSQGASIGANATILPGLVIGRQAVVGAGAVVTSDVPPRAVVVGNPAYIIRYVDARRVDAAPVSAADAPSTGWRSRVAGVALHPVAVISDLRGSLAVVEQGRGLPFPPRRCFTIFDVPNREVRGEHAHRSLHQFLVCLRGRCSVVVDDTEHSEEIVLNTPRLGLHLPPMVWAIQFKFSSDAVLQVLASEGYDAADYIRDYDEYRALMRAAKA